MKIVKRFFSFLKKRYLIIILIAGLVIIFSTSIAFYLNVGKDAAISNASNDWANFGSYYGGVTSSLLSFISIILIIITIQNQSEESQKLELLNRQYIEELRKHELEKNLSVEYDNIVSFLKIKILSFPNKSNTEFGLVAWGITEESKIDPTELKKAKKNLYPFISMYISYIGIYENEYTNDFFCKSHKQKAKILLTFIESNFNKNDKKELEPSLSSCWSALENKNCL
jgi:uncharacterized membrane protein